MPSTTSKSTPTDPPPVEAPAAGDADLRRENTKLRQQLRDAGITPQTDPYVPSFPMSEGIRADLEQLKARADADGRKYDAKGPDGELVYTTSDPVTGKVFTIGDLPK